MNEITDRSIMSALGRQLTVAVARQATAAGNLANVDTPGYRAREVAFDDVLNEQLAGSRPAIRTREAEGLPTRRDGNTVELDRELLQMSRASADFTAAQTALSAKFRLVRYAINESK